MNSENKSKNKKKKRHGNFLYDFVRITGGIPVLLYMRPKNLYPQGNKDAKGKVLISANHTSFLDPISAHVAFLNRRLYILATKDLFETRLKDFFFKRAHCIKVDKDNFNMSSFHEVVERLNENCAVLIFPEGQVNREAENQLLAFKSGAVLMALRAKAPIQPIYIVNREKWYKRQVVVKGAPIDVSSMVGKIPTKADIDRITEYIRLKEIELKQYYEDYIRAKKKK